MAEMSQETPLDGNFASPNIELQPSPSEETTDNIRGMNPTQDQDCLLNVAQDEDQGQDSLHSPNHQDQSLQRVDQIQDSFRCSDHNQFLLERPDNICLGEGKDHSPNYLDQQQAQDQPQLVQEQHKSNLHDSTKEPSHLEPLNLDQDQAKDQYDLNSLNSAQNHERLHSPPEQEPQEKAEAQDHTRLYSSDQDQPQDQQEQQGVDQSPLEVQDGNGQSVALDQDKSRGSDQLQTDQPHCLAVSVQDQLENLDHIPQGNPEQYCDHDLDQQQRRGQRVERGQDQPSADQDPQLLEPGGSSLHNISSHFTIKDQVQSQHSHDDLIGKHDLQPHAEQTATQDQDQVIHQGGGGREESIVQQTFYHPVQDLTTAAANCVDEAEEESGGSIPAVVITQADESRGPALGQRGQLVTPAEPKKPVRPTDLVLAVALPMSTEPSPSPRDGGDNMACSDLMSLKSDTISLTSETAISRRSEEGQEDDTRSVTASSVMSLFHRVQMDPLEKDWLRSSALGNTAAQRQLLAQDPGLALKKTALHWAAKQGRMETVDLTVRSGVDVNLRSGYTALHLASIHGHHHIVQALINIYNAKTNIRDYHGKMAVHYWSGNKDVFNKICSQSGGTFSQGRKTQRYTLPSLLLSRSRSQSQLNLDFGTVPQSPRRDIFYLQI